MSSANEIQEEINSMVEGNYDDWIIGVTDDPERMKINCGKPLSWHKFEADTEIDARKAEKYFRELGMHVGEQGDDADYVYVYRNDE